MKFASALTILFIGLKLSDYTDWPWWLILIPLYTTPLLIILLAFTEGAIKEYKRSKRMK